MAPRVWRQEMMLCQVSHSLVTYAWPQICTLRCMCSMMQTIDVMYRVVFATGVCQKQCWIVQCLSTRCCMSAGDQVVDSSIHLRHVRCICLWKKHHVDYMHVIAAAAVGVRPCELYCCLDGHWWWWWCVCVCIFWCGCHH
jgi:hypothetical protein